MKKMVLVLFAGILLASFAQAGKIENDVGKIWKTLKYGRNNSIETNETAPIDMVKVYVGATYEENIGSYKFPKNESSLNVEKTYVAGLLKKEKVNELVRDALEGYYSVEEDSDAIEDVMQKIDRLNDAGAVFGFDGGGQNGCSESTPMLLVMDPKTTMVYSVDLNPCEE